MASSPSLPEQFINWRVQNAQHDASVEDAQRDFLTQHLKRKGLMEVLIDHPAWKLINEFLVGKAQEAQRAAEDATSPHEMATNLMLAKAYRSLITFPADTIRMADALAKQQR